MIKQFNLKIIIGLLLTISIISCASSADPYSEDLTPAEYFQKGYEAADQMDYALALNYYEAFMVKYPDELERNLWAEFEIAFIYHKMKDDVKAVELLDALISRYTEEDSSTYPAAPKRLAEKVKAEITEKKK